MNETRRGYIYALAASLCAGAMPALSKVLVAEVQPLLSSGLVFFLAGAVLLPYRPKQFPGRASAPWMLGTGLLGAALAPSLYLMGVDQTSAINASLLTNTEVFFTILVAVFVFSETLKRRQLAEGALVMVGVIIVATNLDLGKVQLLQGVGGNALVIGSAFVWSIDNNLSRITSQRFGPLFVAKFRNIVGGSIVLAYAAFVALPFSVPINAIPFLLGLIVVIVSSTLFFMGALVRIGAVRSLLVFSSSTIFGSLFAMTFLGETITLVQVIGGGLILMGVFLIQRSEGTHEASTLKSTGSRVPGVP